MSIILKRTSALILALMCVFSVSFAAFAEDTVIAGGDVFGVKFFMKGALVVGMTSVETAAGLKSPASEAGLKPGDVITAVDGTEVTSARELERIIAESNSGSVTLTVERSGEKLKLKVKPQTEYPSGRKKIGVWVKDSAAGIGTVTFVMADGSFGGLGHAITDPETMSILSPGSGAVVDVKLQSIVKGKRNSPGEIKGSFDSKRVGSINSNTVSGVFGRLAKVPDREMISVGHAHEGRAEIRCTLGDDGIKSYSVELERISEGETKNFVIHVTDRELINRTGGIIQGMSGSPVIQDGRLVGAVTHVLVSDPKYGYGIFIENMLGAIKKRAEVSASASLC